MKCSNMCTSYVETFPAADVTVVVFHDPTVALYISCSIFEINAGKDTTTRLSLWSEVSITSCHGSSRSSFMLHGKWLERSGSVQLPEVPGRLQTLANVPIPTLRPSISRTNIAFRWSGPLDHCHIPPITWQLNQSKCFCQWMWGWRIKDCSFIFQKNTDLFYCSSSLYEYLLSRINTSSRIQRECIRDCTVAHIQDENVRYKHTSK